MSFMPSPGSVVRLDDGSIAIVTAVTPDGKGDLAWDGKEEFGISIDSIVELIYEPECSGSDYWPRRRYETKGEQ
jgi:hypothetical protein